VRSAGEARHPAATRHGAPSPSTDAVQAEAAARHAPSRGQERWQDHGKERPFPATRRHDFGTTDTVHHTNYFEQPQTLDFIMKKLV
jgi:hypothetical protein